MIIVLSPAKNLDYTQASSAIVQTMPRLDKDIAVLSKIAANLSHRQISKLMDLSESLTDLNWQRFQALQDPNIQQSGLQAIFAFNGDVYQGLRARELDVADIDWAQDHLRILSGLYGVLRPLDMMAPYRLEMGTALRTARGKNLYEFWGSRIAKTLNEDLAKAASPIVVNLASSEYFGAVDTKALKAKVLTCHFKEVKDAKARVLSFYAKRARGMMARFAITQRICVPEGLKDFREAGYSFNENLSTSSDYVFTRPQPEVA